MIKIGVADYGINVWDGALYDYRDRLEMLKSIGYDGIERLEAKTQAEAIDYMADAKYMGMDFATCRGGCINETIRWTAALGKEYIWADSSAKDFDTYCRQINKQTAVAAKYGVKVALHNHLGLVVETQEQVEKFFQSCPDCKLILDVGHLAAAGGDPLYIIDKYFDKIQIVHLKDFVYKNKDADMWWDRIRFCELGAGEMGDTNRKIIEKLLEKGYDGWLLVEHDTHLQEPIKDLKISRDYIRSCGI